MLLLPNSSLVLRAFAVLANAAPGKVNYDYHMSYIKDFQSAGYTSALSQVFKTVTDKALGDLVLANLGLSSVFTSAQAEAYFKANAADRVAAAMTLSDALLNYTGADAGIKAAQATFSNKIDYSFNWSTTSAAVSNFPSNIDLTTFELTTAKDTLIGSAGNDMFKAYIIDNTNTLQSGDVIQGGAGLDTLFADIGASQNFAITATTTGVETVQIRAEAAPNDITNGNNTSSGLFNGLVQIDAQRMSGVNLWESTNSRSDVVIEDVRIADDQKTKDVTIAFVESDPGNVDYGVYFDQQSLRNNASSTTALTLRVMDTGAAADPATAATPLLNQPYDVFKLGINGVLTSIQLDKAAVKAADTYAALLTVFQNALAGTGLSVSLGANFTVTDPITSKAVTGQAIIITGNASAVISTPADSGWYNTTGASVPANSNIYTYFGSGETTTTELVTSKVILDDVGRSNLGGDLVIGGMSTGDTSNYAIYRGVERFEIEVRDNSKLQTINSTNNALREVTITSGATSRTTKDAYTTTVTNEGDLVVNGDAATNLALADTTSQIRGQSYAVPAGGAQSGGNNQLPGVENNSPVGIHHGAGATGFTDVRLIDASEFKGKLGFTASITQDSIAKYNNLIDTAASPTADVANNGNVNFGVRGANFIYTGGNDDDTMTVSIDGATASSRSTVVSGNSDFTFAFNGGAGNDALTVSVINGQLAGGQQAWYNNQKLNANIAIGGGDGDDVIRKPGAGDVIIDAGTGNDTVYTDNTGALNVTTISNGANSLLAQAYIKASSAELAAAQAARVADATTGVIFNQFSLDNNVIAPAAVVNALTVLDAATAVTLPAGGVGRAAINGAIDAAFNAGALTLAQVKALKLAYNTASDVTLTPASINTMANQAYVDVPPAVPGGVNLSAAEFAAGNTLLASYLTAARAAVAADTAAAVNEAYQNGLLNATQTAVANAQEVVSKVWEGGLSAVGTQVKLDALNVLKGALVAGATDATVVAALRTATQAGAIDWPTANALFGAATAGGAGTVDANPGGELAGITAILTPLITAAANANTVALANLATAVAANTAAVDAVANGAAPALQDSFGAAATAAAQAAAKTQSDNAGKALAAAQAIETALNALKAGVTVGASDTQIQDALDIATNTIASEVAKAAAAGYVIGNPLAGNQAALKAQATTAPGLAATVSVTEKAVFDTGYDNSLTNAVVSAMNVDALITANRVTVDNLTAQVADKAAVLAATTTAATEAALAAASGTNTGVSPLPNAGFANFVFNTSNQRSDYDRLALDDRSLVDLKSDANNAYNFFNAKLTVNYKGIESAVTVAGTGYKTTDLELNQAIKQAINNDAVLSKLLLATDGPANTLVVTAKIDGAHVTSNLALSLTMPATLTAADVSGAATAYGLAAGATDVQVLAAITAANASFVAKGDYVTQFAESGIANGNAVLTGANSTASSDNTITLGTGNDVLVLGTTVGMDSMTSSNEKVVYSGVFGNDTIVNFAATGLGIDVLDFSALGGRGTTTLGSLTADKSIVIGTPLAVGATPLTDVQIAALFTDSATAMTHVYVQVDSTNIGSVWQVTDAAGTAAGNVTAKLVGSIDLADTAWGTLTAANFA